MKKWIVWVVILVVVVVVIAVIASGGKKGGMPTVTKEGFETGFSKTTYDAVSARILGQTDDFGRQRLLGQFRNYTIQGDGWVVSADQQGDGSWVLKINADQAGSGEPPVTMTVPPGKTAGATLPSVGQEVRYAGRADSIRVSNDGRLIVTLIEGRLVQPGK